MSKDVRGVLVAALIGASLAVAVCVLAVVLL